MSMTYKETINFLYSSLPMFHRVGPSAFQPGLKNIYRLCESFENPQNCYKTIHIAGTNGKGSVSHILASILQHAGYKTGLYTSPHLLDFRERIKVNGIMIPEEFVISFVEKCLSVIDNIKPSFFELSTAMAFNYFAKSNIDIAVIETGLGGRLDSTNIITPELSIITNVSYDHTDILGNTLEQIATEKAGIIKHGIPVLIGETNIQTKDVFLSKAKAEGSEIYFADQLYITNRNNFKDIAHQFINIESQSGCYPSFVKEYKLDLLGNYQQKNLVTVQASLDILLNKGFQISVDNIEEGLTNVISTTGLAGRWQILNKQPLVIADTGHNEAGLTYTMQQLKDLSCKTLHLVVGFVKDKDIDKILKILPLKGQYYFTKANIPRALDEKILSEKAKYIGLKGKSYSSVQDAIKAARLSASIDDAIYIGGSTYIVGEALEQFKN
jgi:dihydrofolate synthase / folylpolyglutamate synthase